MTININSKLVYLLAGAAAGILFAPKSGREMRSTVSGKIGDLTDRIQGDGGIGESVTHTFRNAVERGKNIASISRQRLNESIEAGKRKYNESLESFDTGETDVASR